MKAVFKLNTLCVVVEDSKEGVLLEPVEGDEDQRFWVPFDSPSLILNPTDDEVEDLQCVN